MAFAMRRGVAPLIRASAPARNSTGATFPPGEVTLSSAIRGQSALTRRACVCAVKTGRPDTYELSRKQNEVRLHARERKLIISESVVAICL